MKSAVQQTKHINEDFSAVNTMCSICVATYQRPELLRGLLQSLYRQVLPFNVELEIIVVDNDLKKSAEHIVSQFSKSKNVSLNYYVQPKKNISLARNLSIEKASGDFLLFIDDDEVACDEWVRNLLNAIKKYNADGAFGYVTPVFNDDTPNWMRRRDLFFYGFTGETGTEAKATYTNNCIIKATLLKCIDKPFDPSYGTSGGEDIKLFHSLVLEGARFVNCREAVVTEFLPPSRTRMGYFYTRAVSGGNRHTRTRIEASPQFPSLVRFMMVLKSLVYGMISFLLFFILFPNKVLRVKWLIKAASNIGRFKAAFGFYYEPYK